MRDLYTCVGKILVEKWIKQNNTTDSIDISLFN